MASDLRPPYGTAWEYINTMIPEIAADYPTLQHVAPRACSIQIMAHLAVTNPLRWRGSRVSAEWKTKEHPQAPRGDTGLKAVLVQVTGQLASEGHACDRCTTGSFATWVGCVRAAFGPRSGLACANCQYAGVEHSCRVSQARPTPSIDQTLRSHSSSPGHVSSLPPPPPSTSAARRNKAPPTAKRTFEESGREEEEVHPRKKSRLPVADSGARSAPTAWEALQKAYPAALRKIFDARDDPIIAFLAEQPAADGALEYSPQCAKKGRTFNLPESSRPLQMINVTAGLVQAAGIPFEYVHVPNSLPTQSIIHQAPLR